MTARLLACLIVSILASGGAASARDSAFETSFDSMHLKGWSIGHYNFSSPKFATDWRSWQTEIGNGLLLSLDPHPRCPNAYAGASIRRSEPTGFGRYSATLKAASGAGVITGFFTYTGAYYGTPHDEIDIEILGKDTTKINIAWFADGKRSDRIIDLGFDAAEGMHDYAFEWREDRIDWYVDGRLIFTATAEDGPLPKSPGMLFANVWAADASIASWSGKIGPDVRTRAQIARLGFVPFGEHDRGRRVRSVAIDEPLMSRPGRGRQSTPTPAHRRGR